MRQLLKIDEQASSEDVAPWLSEGSNLAHLAGISPLVDKDSDLASSMRGDFSIVARATFDNSTVLALAEGLHTCHVQVNHRIAMDSAVQRSLNEARLLLNTEVIELGHLRVVLMMHDLPLSVVHVHSPLAYVPGTTFRDVRYFAFLVASR